MILLLDNHDSFTWNLVELLRLIGKVNVNICSEEMFRISDLVEYDRVVFSPGPGLPEEHPVMFEILQGVGNLRQDNGKLIPVFGVCLGMQAIAQFFGGNLFNLRDVVHGQPRKLKIIRRDHPLFIGIDQNTTVGLYHSWAVDRDSLPESLEVLALSEEGTIMALAHKTLPFCGVQFHPESIMTPEGKQMMSNWLSLAS
ncbi:MAG: aminodeoxychorismate/anthranilate synthase component II [Bacteroidales bacterium]|jgi:anthranilate synthase component 2|nr:aminodeoxychorismate/anthranilate synthase component II [Bacteroidales bacterium]